MRFPALKAALLVITACASGPATGAYAQLTDAQLTDAQLTDAQLADAQLADVQLADVQLADAHSPAAPRSVVLKPAPHRPSPPATLWEAPSRRLCPDTTRRRPHDPWWALDKAEHAGGSFLLVLGGQYVFEKKASLERDPALALSLGSGAAIGLAKELYDRRFGPARDFSARDLAADALGLLLGAGVVVL